MAPRSCPRSRNHASAAKSSKTRTVISSGVFCKELVGRARELAHLTARARGDGARRSALVVVRGEAGVGKSRLVAEFVAAVAREQVRTVVTGVREYANAPYAAIVEALDSLGADARLGRQSEHGAAVPEAEADGDEKSRRFASVAATFAQLARAEPVGLLVVLEDLHWADGGTVELLRFLAHRLADEPVTFVATYRIDDGDAEAERVRVLVLGALERAAEDTIVLEPLGDGEIDQLLRAALADVDRTLPAAALERIRELAEGRPLFAEELLRGALERSDRDGVAVMVPASIRVTVRERFASLPERDRDVLLQAAVLGRRFSAHFVARLTGVAPVAVFAALRRARDLQLVVEEHDDDRGDCFAFRHAVTREAVYAELLRAEARTLHAHVAEALANEEPLDVTAIAEHAWRARDVEHAIGWNERAGDDAVALFAYADAARHYVRACDVATDREQRALLAEKAAESLYATGDVASAVDRLALAIEAHGAGPDANRLALRRAVPAVRARPLRRRRARGARRRAAAGARRLRAALRRRDDDRRAAGGARPRRGRARAPPARGRARRARGDAVGRALRRQLRVLLGDPRPRRRGARAVRAKRSASRASAPTSTCWCARSTTTRTWSSSTAPSPTRGGCTTKGSRSRAP